MGRPLEHQDLQAALTQSQEELERARQRLQGHREGMQDAIRMNAEQLASQKKAEADVLRDQSKRISAYVAMQQAQHGSIRVL